MSVFACAMGKVQLGGGATAPRYSPANITGIFMGSHCFTNKRYL